MIKISLLFFLGIILVFASGWRAVLPFYHKTAPSACPFQLPQRRFSRLFDSHNHRFSFMSLYASVGGMPDNSNKPQKTVVISPSTSTDFVQEIILQNFNQIQGESQGRIAIIGTSELDANQQQMIELLSYALVLSGNHVFTSGGGNGTNLAVIRGALRACNADLLTVMLPQSLYRQPSEMQGLLTRVANLVEQPENDGLGLREAAQLCNYKLLSMVDKVIVFVYHDSTTILNPLEDFEEVVEIVRFYFD